MFLITVTALNILLFYIILSKNYPNPEEKNDCKVNCLVVIAEE